LQLREEMLRLERENAELKRQTLREKLNGQEDSEDLDMKSGPTSIHVSENCDENHNKTKQIDDNYPPELVHSLRAEIFALKEWKSRATQEIVDRDCALVDLEQELVKQQSEFDANSEECTGHQRVIQELKSQLDQISIGERTMEGSPFSERPVSSHSAYCQQRLEENRQQHKNSIFHPPSSIPEEEKTSNKFQSSFARSLNLPPCAMDERTWLANELLETRQRLIQTEADLMRLEEVHSSLFNEHKNLQEDYERIHIYVEELEAKLEDMLQEKVPPVLPTDEEFEIEKTKAEVAVLKKELAEKREKDEVSEHAYS